MSLAATRSAFISWMSTEDPSSSALLPEPPHPQPFSPCAGRREHDPFPPLPSPTGEGVGGEGGRWRGGGVKVFQRVGVQGRHWHKSDLLHHLQPIEIQQRWEGHVRLGLVPERRAGDIVLQRQVALLPF